MDKNFRHSHAHFFLYRGLADTFKCGPIEKRAFVTLRGTFHFNGGVQPACVHFFPRGDCSTRRPFFCDLPAGGAPVGRTARRRPPSEGRVGRTPRAPLRNKADANDILSWGCVTERRLQLLQSKALVKLRNILHAPVGKNWATNPRTGGC